MAVQPKKLTATTVDGAGMEQASTNEGNTGHLINQQTEEQKISAEDGAAQLGDFA